MSSSITLITSAGLSAITQASPLGPLVSICYYVPVYDYRIDKNVEPIDSGFVDGELQISNVASIADEVPTGDVYWNPNNGQSYALTSEDYVYIKKLNSTITESGTRIQYPNATNGQENYDSVVTLNGYTLDSYYYTLKTNLPVYNDAGHYWQISTGTWQETTVNTSYKPTTPESPLASNLYTGVTYSSVTDNDVADKTRANFRVTVNSPSGTIKFNKLGLYSATYHEGVLPVEPKLFAEVIIPEPQLLSNQYEADGRASQIIVDFQMQFGHTSASFDNVLFATSADYWQMVSNAQGSTCLHSPSKVYISSESDSSDTGINLNDPGKAKLLVSTKQGQPILPNNPSVVEDVLPQLSLQYVTNPVPPLVARRVRADFKVDGLGDLIVNILNPDPNNNPYPAIRPNVTESISLGSSTKKWKNIYASDILSVGNDTYNFKVDPTLSTVSSTYEYFVVGRIDTIPGIGDVQYGGVYSNLFPYYKLVDDEKQYEPLVVSSWGSNKKLYITSKLIEDSAVDIANKVDEYVNSNYSTSDIVTYTNDTNAVVISSSDNIFIVGKLNVFNHILPYKNSDINLGSSDLKFNMLWNKEIYTSKFSIDTDEFYAKNIITHNIMPSTDNQNTYEIGSDSNRFNKGYFNYITVKNDINTNEGYTTLVGNAFLAKVKTNLLDVNEASINGITKSGSIAPGGGGYTIGTGSTTSASYYSTSYISSTRTNSITALTSNTNLTIGTDVAYADLNPIGYFKSIKVQTLNMVDASAVANITSANITSVNITNINNKPYTTGTISVPNSKITVISNTDAIGVVTSGAQVTSAGIVSSSASASIPISYSIDNGIVVINIPTFWFYDTQQVFGIQLELVSSVLTTNIASSLNNIKVGYTASASTSFTLSIDKLYKPVYNQSLTPMSYSVFTSGGKTYIHIRNSGFAAEYYWIAYAQDFTIIP